MNEVQRPAAGEILIGATIGRRAIHTVDNHRWRAFYSDIVFTTGTGARRTAGARQQSKAGSKTTSELVLHPSRITHALLSVQTGKRLLRFSGIVLAR